MPTTSHKTAYGKPAGGQPSQGPAEAEGSFYRRRGKRALDVALSAGALAALALPMAAIAAAVRLDDPAGPAIFVQERLGLGGRPFSMYKFRTMSVGAEGTGSGVYSGEGDPRVTRVGALLRRTSADELPQLLNVLKGDMSLVGPRPPLAYHPWPLEEYTPRQLRMFSVRPGLTGWAQVHGRRTVEWERRIGYNVWYADNLSLRLDARILALTVGKILKAEDNLNVGATAPGTGKARDASEAPESATAPEAAEAPEAAPEAQALPC